MEASTLINKNRLYDMLKKYKKEFITKQWPTEKYKWEAVKCFQDNWDIRLNDFTSMLKRSLAKTMNLLASNNYYPKGMIEKFSAAAPEEVRAMFIALYDERKDIYERIDAFKSQSITLFDKYSKGSKQHYQYESAISTYLWLRYPDKYSSYKYIENKTVSDKLESGYQFKKGAYEENIRNSIKLYDELCLEVQKDKELIELFKSQLTESCYPDPALRTLTSDVCYYISRFYAEKVKTGSKEWFPTDYTPGLKMKDWIRLLNDPFVFTTESLEIMKRLKDYGGQATCTQLSIKYGKTRNFYINGSVALARRIVKKTNCPIMDRDEDSFRWWPVLYIGRFADNNEEGGYIWKLRDELSAALDKINLDEIILYAVPSDDNNIIREDLLINTQEANETYNKESFLSEVYLNEERYDTLCSILENKLNIILQGAPGVGKTFAAKRLAYSMMGEIDDDRIEFIQFHQNYSYEDFIMGYKPGEDGFELKYGIFYKFCQKAANQPNKTFFFIIDEINRGNLSKIFGELLMLIERDYREHKLVLAYNGLQFSVPKNLYIIGMMNTADRSLAMIDYALRRRFSFFEMEPAFINSESFRNYQYALNDETFNALISEIVELNKQIASDRSLGKGFCIGHSYFCGKESCSVEWLKEVVEFEIIPMLSEYWFDDDDKLHRWENRLHGIFND